MKTSLSIIFLSLFCSYHAHAQTATSASSGKKAQLQTVTQTVQQPEPLKATVVTAEKNAEVKEVPLENNQTVAPESKGATSSARKPD
jgi:hypothetical protein